MSFPVCLFYAVIADPVSPSPACRHTHYNFDFRLRGTRVLSNQWGYRDAKSPKRNYRPYLTVYVPGYRRSGPPAAAGNNQNQNQPRQLQQSQQQQSQQQQGQHPSRTPTATPPAAATSPARSRPEVMEARPNYPPPPPRSPSSCRLSPDAPAFVPGSSTTTNSNAPLQQSPAPAAQQQQAAPQAAATSLPVVGPSFSMWTSEVAAVAPQQPAHAAPPPLFGYGAAGGILSSSCPLEAAWEHDRNYTGPCPMEIDG